MVEIVQHFGKTGRQFKHALVEARLVLRPIAQLARIDAVGGGGKAEGAVAGRQMGKRDSNARLADGFDPP